MAGLVKKTPELVAKAKALVMSHMSLHAVGREIGIAPETVKCWIDPAYNARRNAGRGHSGAGHASGVRVYNNARSVEVDARRLARTIPADTRTTDALITGCPLPGRSALDRKLMERGR